MDNFASGGEGRGDGEEVEEEQTEEEGKELD